MATEIQQLLESWDLAGCSLFQYLDICSHQYVGIKVLSIQYFPGQRSFPKEKFQFVDTESLFHTEQYLHTGEHS